MGSYKGGRQGDQCKHSGNIQVWDDGRLDTSGNHGGGKKWPEFKYLEGRADTIYEWVWAHVIGW